MNVYSTNHFQPQQSSNTAYGCLTNHSHFKRPYNDRFSYHIYQEPQHRQFQWQICEPTSLQPSHSSEDFLLPPIDSMYSQTMSQNSSHRPRTCDEKFRPNSDFIQSNQCRNSLSRPYDILNDFPDRNATFSIHQQYPFSKQQPNSYRPTQISNEYRIPISRHQCNTTREAIYECK